MTKARERGLSVISNILIILMWPCIPYSLLLWCSRAEVSKPWPSDCFCLTPSLEWSYFCLFVNLLFIFKGERDRQRKRERKKGREGGREEKRERRRGEHGGNSSSSDRSYVLWNLKSYHLASYKKMFADSCSRGLPELSWVLLIISPKWVKLEMFQTF